MYDHSSKSVLGIYFRVSAKLLKCIYNKQHFISFYILKNNLHNIFVALFLGFSSYLFFFFLFIFLLDIQPSLSALPTLIFCG